MDLAIRLDIRSEDNVQQLVGLLDSVGGAYWVVREGGTTNPHLHVHLRTTKSLNAVRLAFKKRFVSHVGNGGYSIKQCDSDVTGYDRYLAKGDSEGDEPIVIARHGVEFTDAVVKAWHTEYWNVNQELMRKRRKKLAGCVTDQLLQRCLDKGISKRALIGSEYLFMCKEANRPINVFAGKAAINIVWLKLCDSTEAHNVLLAELVGRDAEDHYL